MTISTDLLKLETNSKVFERGEEFFEKKPNNELSFIKDGVIVSTVSIPDGSADTPSEIVDKLEMLTGEDRIDASAIKNISVIGSQKNITAIVSTVDTSIQNTNVGNLQFNSFSSESSSNPLVTFNGEILTIPSNINRLKIESYIQTRGELDMQGSYYFAETSKSSLTLGETLQNATATIGIYGNNSTNTPATVILPPNTNIDLYLVHDESIGNQVIKTGSIIIITEI